MAEPQFFSRPKGMTVGEIVSLTGAEAADGTDLARSITSLAPVDQAGPNDLSFIEKPKFLDALTSCRAGVLLTSKRFESQTPAGVVVLRSNAPYRAFVAVARVLYPESLRPMSAYGDEGVAHGATVHPTAKLGAGVTVDPGAVIGANAEIGAGTVICANTTIGKNVRIGRDCSIGPNSTVIHAVIGDRVIIHPGCHIGQDGFGFIPDSNGHVKVPQIGAVIIHNDVEIGASTNVDRGGIRNTVIGEGCKIDNLVQIAHNATMGKHCILAGQSGMSGSSTLGDFVILAAGAGVRDHVTVNDGAQLAARSTVIRDVPKGARWGGFPNAKPIKQWLRETIILERLGMSGGKDIKRPDMDD
ncbi:unnamed protein product [Phaeothamnion confervicola]